MRYRLRRVDDGRYLTTSFFGLAREPVGIDWTTDRALAWGFNVRLFVDLVADRVRKDHGVHTYVETSDD